MSTPPPKAALRQHIRQALTDLSPELRKQASEQACLLLSKQGLWQRARVVLFYAPMGDELDVWPLAHSALAAGKTVALPQFDTAKNRYYPCELKDLQRDVRIAQFGIREPVSGCVSIALNRLDFILVPGVAFDLHGHRLGRGKGYYDQLLAAVSGKHCGVAFDEQIVGLVPVEPHDSDVNCILTPTRWIEL